MWKLVIEDDEARRTVVPLSRDAYDVGRAEENAIRLTERNVSRRHARLERRAATDGGESYRLEDLASLTGVYVNGVRLEEPVELAHGDLVVIGDYRIAIESEGAAPVVHETTNPELKVTRREQQADPYRLLVVSGPDAGKVFPLGAGRTVLGRAEDATIQLAHPSVSRHHAEVVVLPDGRLELVDSGSSNGLVLNGKTIRREILEGGDLFELGDVRVRVLEPGAPVPTLAAAEAEAAPEAERARAWLPAAAFAAVVIIGGTAAYIARQPSRMPSGGSVDTLTPPAALPATEPSPESAVAPPEMPAAAPAPTGDPIEEATALCKRQECDRARELVDARLAANDPSLDGPAGKAFFHDWAVDLIARARLESDVELKRQLLARVRLEIHTPPADRERAKRALDAIVAAKPAATGSAAAQAAAPSVSGAPATSTKREPAAIAAPSPAPAVSPEKPEKPEKSGKSGAERAPRPGRTEDPDKIRAWMMGTDAEKKLARDYLYGRFQHGQASRDELKGLQGLCKDLGDAKCVEDVKAARSQEPPR
jgi:pSer/pThr/pTyr-binding forkhead associated (FHA) protein